MSRHQPYRTGNVFVCGSTRSGKSVGQWNEVVCAADAKDVAIVVIDPHEESLAWNCFQQLIAGGHEHRIIYDQLHHNTHVPGYRFLKQSTARDATERAVENEESAKGFTDILCRRGGVNLASQPQKEEWILKAVKFLLSQSSERPASDLRYCFKPTHPKLVSLLKACTDEELRQEFSAIAEGTIKSGQYHSAARLIEGTCGSIPFIVQTGNEFEVSEPSVFLSRALGAGFVSSVESVFSSPPSFFMFQFVSFSLSWWIFTVSGKLIEAGCLEADVFLAACWRL